MASHRSHNTIWFNFPINDIKWRKAWLRMCTYHVASICCEWVLFIARNRWSGRQIFPTCPTIVRLFGHDERKNGQAVCVPALLVFPTCVVMKLCGDVIICVRHIVLLPLSVYNTPDQCSPSTWYHPAYKMSNQKYLTLNFRWQVSCTRHEYPKPNFWTTESNQFIFVPSDQTLNNSPSTKHCEPETNRVLHVTKHISGRLGNILTCCVANVIWHEHVHPCFGIFWNSQLSFSSYVSHCAWPVMDMIELRMLCIGHGV